MCSSNLSIAGAIANPVDMLSGGLVGFITTDGIGELRLVPRGRPIGRGLCDGFLPEGGGSLRMKASI